MNNVFGYRKDFSLNIVNRANAFHTQEQNGLRKELEEERRARKRLETLLRKSLKHIIDVNSNEETA